MGWFESGSWQRWISMAVATQTDLTSEGGNLLRDICVVFVSLKCYRKALETEFSLCGENFQKTKLYAFDGSGRAQGRQRWKILTERSVHTEAEGSILKRQQPLGRSSLRKTCNEYISWGYLISKKIEEVSL